MILKPPQWQGHRHTLYKTTIHIFFDLKKVYFYRFFISEFIFDWFATGFEITSHHWRTSIKICGLLRHGSSHVFFTAINFIYFLPLLCNFKLCQKEAKIDKNILFWLPTNMHFYWCIIISFFLKLKYFS